MTHPIPLAHSESLVSLNYIALPTQLPSHSVTCGGHIYTYTGQRPFLLVNPFSPQETSHTNKGSCSNIFHYPIVTHERVACMHIPREWLNIGHVSQLNASESTYKNCTQAFTPSSNQMSTVYCHKVSNLSSNSSVHHSSETFFSGVDANLENSSFKKEESTIQPEKFNRKKKFLNNSIIKSKANKTRIKKVVKFFKACTHCGRTETPEWRKGPLGRATLCNACGLQYSKFLREKPRRQGIEGKISFILNTSKKPV